MVGDSPLSSRSSSSSSAVEMAATLRLPSPFSTGCDWLLLVGDIANTGDAEAAGAGRLLCALLLELATAGRCLAWLLVLLLLLLVAWLLLFLLWDLLWKKVPWLLADAAAEDVP